MGHDWILDVLTDLKAFARANGLPTLAAQLDDATLVAQIEMASQVEGNGLGIGGKCTAVGRADRRIGIR